MSIPHSSHQLEPSTTAEDSAVSVHNPGTVLRSHLFVVLECDRPLAGGARYSLENIDEVIIGRGLERRARCELAGNQQRLLLQVPGSRMSALHARLIKRSSGWELIDANSTNGSYLNGQRTSRATLSDGDCVQLGRTIFTLRFAQLTSPYAPTTVDTLIQESKARELVTLDPLVAEAFDELTRLATSTLPIVLIGETGTGKEVVARAIHALSARPGDFVAVNCGTLPATLLESLLFGHVRGSFSGATRDECGYIRSADGGTLFLDEIAELPRQAQVALLRVLQESEVVPLGSPRAIKVDVRVVAACQQPLETLQAAREFRQDLRARLEGHTMRLVPLAQRREDLGVIISLLLGRIRPEAPSFHASVGQMFWEYPWPCNIRELDLVLKRAVTLAGDGPIRLDHLPAAMSSLVAQKRNPPNITETRAISSAISSGVVTALSPSDAKLRAQVVQWLREHQGNVSEVARVSGKARTQIQRWMRRFCINAVEYRLSEK